jgi:UDP-N-acetylglucosamine 1-carboxyvinyltransferase
MADYFEITGGARLSGEVPVNGSKNASLPILAATLIAPGEYDLHNVPHVEDIEMFLEIMGTLGVRSRRDDSAIAVDTTNVRLGQVPSKMTTKLRGSLYLLGSLLSRTGRASLGYPGGCGFDRPFDFHVTGLRELGAEIYLRDGGIDGKASRFRGAKIILPFPSLGATCNLVIAATRADGCSSIVNASSAPEVADLCSFLNTMGARITGVGTRTLVIEGVDRLQPAVHTVMPDRAEAATLLLAAIMTRGEVLLTGCRRSLVRALNALLERCGAALGELENGIAVGPGTGAPIESFDVVTGPDPALWTDWQPHITALASMCRGESTVTDRYYFGRRSQYVGQLNRLGARISTEGNTIRISGPSDLVGADASATDIQGGTALVLAALVARGTTRVFDANTIDRGYARLEIKLSRLGARIARRTL